ncbi:hypothetical protein Cgig2_016416 [Carnegiea gigantea]|uniref:Uncharacterized protein n=1 Tax=Carnegiea gigantea TaxID=171969 RepID=A0A9Q1Q4Q0_9CARY|nr:hypothetical protein Cgig2_016410 [Carnegiea gigantea]KAJ8429133.1 hypothetical protein Cgig2_016416 [Carnegiea gigantea]
MVEDNGGQNGNNTLVMSSIESQSQNNACKSKVLTKSRKRKNILLKKKTRFIPRSPLAPITSVVNPLNAPVFSSFQALPRNDNLNKENQVPINDDSDQVERLDSSGQWDTQSYAAPLGSNNTETSCVIETPPCVVVQLVNLHDPKILTLFETKISEQ